MSVSILPSNAGAFEKAVSAVSSSRRQLSSDLIRAVKNPDQCSLDLLPILAAEYSVDIWDEAWDEQKKRSVVRDAVRHHRLKGTLAGISAYAGLVNAEVVSAIRPPSKFYATASDTLEQRIAWMASLPVVKIYRNVGKEPERLSIFAGSGVRPLFTTGRFATASLADLRSRKRVLLIRDGVETEIGIGYDHEGTRMVLFLHAAGKRIVAGSTSRRYAVPSSATQYVAKISSDRDAYDPAYANPLRPAGTGGGIFPSFSSDPKTIGKVWIAGTIARERYAGVSDAAFRSFERIPLADDLAPSEPGRAISFASHTRLGISAHTAELKVLIPGKTKRHAMIATTAFAGQFAVLADKSRLGDAFKAITAAKRLSDKVMIDTEVYRPVLAGQTLLAGQPIFAGQMTRS